MAEIKIEKKKPLWPWILLLIIIAAAVIWYFMYYNNDIDVVDDVDDIEAVDDVVDDNLAENATTSNAFSRLESDRVMMDFRSSISDSLKLGADMTHTANTFLYLVKAVEIKASQFNIEISETLSPDIYPNAKETSVITASQIKNTSLKIVEAVGKIQQKQFPGLSNDVMDLKIAANEIKPDVSIDAQRTQLFKFLQKAANVLNNMNI